MNHNISRHKFFLEFLRPKVLKSNSYDKDGPITYVWTEAQAKTRQLTEYIEYVP